MVKLPLFVGIVFDLDDTFTRYVQSSGATSNMLNGALSAYNQASRTRFGLPQITLNLKML